MATTPGTELIELETGIFARLHEGLTNAGIIVGDDGVLVIDSLRVPSFARDLIRDVRHITDKPVRYLVRHPLALGPLVGQRGVSRRDHHRPRELLRRDGGRLSGTGSGARR